jgi:hypothetical protein
MTVFTMLRAEIAYFRDWIVGALGIALLVVAMLTVVFATSPDSDAPPHAVAGIRGMFFFMAPMIVAFIIQSYRSEEHRNRLFLVGDVTPTNVATTQALVPIALFAIGLVFGGSMITAESLLTGRFEPEGLRIAVFVGVMMLMMAQLSLLIEETSAAGGQGRRAARWVGWGILSLSGLVFASLTALSILGRVGWLELNLGNLAIALVAPAATIALFSGRHDFTR